MENHPHSRGYRHLTPKPLNSELVKDTFDIALEVLGAEFDDKGQRRWQPVENRLSASGIAVTDGANYFVYEKSMRGDYMGLKRVRRDKSGRISIATQAIRSANQEYSLNRSDKEIAKFSIASLKTFIRAFAHRAHG